MTSTRTASPVLPPMFEASTPLATVLAWPALPEVLRRALRAVPRHSLAQISFGECVSRWREPMFREWIVALLALDIGVGFSDTITDSFIGLFADDRLGAKTIAHFFVPPDDAGQGLGAAYRAPSADAAATVCAAAFVYLDDEAHVEAAFVFLSGATSEPIVQLELPLDERPFDATEIERASQAIATQVAPLHLDAARAVVREALEECRVACFRTMARG